MGRAWRLMAVLVSCSLAAGAAGAAEEPAGEPPLAYLGVGYLLRLHFDEGGSPRTRYGHGLALQADFRVVSDFMLGVAFEYFDMPNNVLRESWFGAGVRPSVSYDLGEHMALVPYGYLGLASYVPTGSCADDCPRTHHGLRMGLGFGIRAMVLPWFGVNIDLHGGGDRIDLGGGVAAKFFVFGLSCSAVFAL